MFLGTGCGSAPPVDYLVRITADGSAIAPASVTMTIPVRAEDRRRGALELRAYQNIQRFRPVEIAAASADGSALPVTAGFDTVSVGSKSAAVARFSIALATPAPSTVTLRYRVNPTFREGDAHVGYTGKYLGYLGTDFGVFAGRSLFLAPADLPDDAPITVDFELPGQWSAFVPWDFRPERYRPGWEGRHTLEHLMAASICVGPFRESRFRLGETSIRLVASLTTPPAARARDSLAIRSATSFLFGKLGRDLGRSYLVIDAPPAADGGEVEAEAWAGGYGRSLSPISASRLHALARAELGSWLRFAPQRTEFEDPHDYWLVDGIEGLYAWRAVSAAGLSEDDAVERALVERYTIAVNTQAARQRLENLYTGNRAEALEAEVVAPTTMAGLAWNLGAGNRDDEWRPLDRAVRKALAKPRIASFWSLLGPEERRSIAEFRRRHVAGSELVPVRELAPPLPLRAFQAPPAARNAREIEILYTGHSDGYLENCGCKTSQLGGFARRATVIARERARRRPVLLVDAGDFVARPSKIRDRDALTSSEESVFLDLMADLRYDAVALGVYELARGGPWLDEVERHRLPVLGANYRVDDAPRPPATRVVVRDGLRIGFVGLCESPAPLDGFQEVNGCAAHVAFDTLDRVLAPIQALAQRCDLVVVAGHVTPEGVRDVVQHVRGPVVVISSAFSGPDGPEPGTPDTLRWGRRDGFLDSAVVVHTRQSRYGVGSVVVSIDPAARRIVGARQKDFWLDDDVPDDRGVRGRLDRFYRDASTRAELHEAVGDPFGDDPLRHFGRYVGAQACESCHTNEYQQWRTTAHAQAFKTLLDVHRNYQPRCVSCHVVGYGAVRGYSVGHLPRDGLVNVQCEVCHGPAGDHVTRPSASNIRRSVPEAVCLTCHTPDHSDAFDYRARLPLVVHQPAIPFQAQAIRAMSASPAPPGGGGESHAPGIRR